MINLIISLVVGAIGTALLYVVYLESFWGGIFPFLLFSIVTYVLLARRTMRELTVIMERAQEKMKRIGQGQTQGRSKKLVEQQLEQAIDVMREGFKLAPYQFMISSQLNGQIGQLYYVQKKFKKARPYLEKSFARNWVSLAMLGCLQLKEKDYDAMRETFEKNVKVNKKESMLWNLYAYCLREAGDRDGAQAVLQRGHDTLPSDDRIKSNLENVKNNRRIKMRGWRELWYQFHLDSPPKPKMRFDKRAMFRGR